ncbi:unnamed protein product [Cuscuta campestris]|uniref:Uncharacterized protein n=1 Tax=Cuscuta campestris TaxID=132261 RepID=A0A484N1P4_9ASTE|nr:unnamed protein product [Cuscuta campestris]
MKVRLHRRRRLVILEEQTGVYNDGDICLKNRPESIAVEAAATLISSSELSSHPQQVEVSRPSLVAVQSPAESFPSIAGEVLLLQVDLSAAVAFQISPAVRQQGRNAS